MPGVPSAPRYSAIYKLLDPPKGVTGTVTVTFSGQVSNGSVAGAADFAGVDLSDPLGTAVGAGSPDNQATAIGVDLSRTQRRRAGLRQRVRGRRLRIADADRGDRPDTALERSQLRVQPGHQHHRCGQHQASLRQLGHHELDGRGHRLARHRGRADQPADSSPSPPPPARTSKTQGERPAGHLDDQPGGRQRRVQHLGGQPRPTTGTWARSTMPPSPSAPPATPTRRPQRAGRLGYRIFVFYRATCGDPWGVYGRLRARRSPSRRRPPRAINVTAPTGTPASYARARRCRSPGRPTRRHQRRVQHLGGQPRQRLVRAARPMPPNAPPATPTRSTSTCRRRRLPRSSSSTAPQRRPLGHLRL